jgi:hypothetical protein
VLVFEGVQLCMVLASQQRGSWVCLLVVSLSGIETTPANQGAPFAMTVEIFPSMMRPYLPLFLK